MRYTRVVMGKTGPEDGVYRDVERPAVAPVAHSVQRRFRALRRESSLRGLLVTLTVDEYRDIIAVSACHYCGCELAVQGSALDRMDPLVGYTPENVVPACASCNKAKLTHDYETWKRIADAYVEKHGRGTMWPAAPRTVTTERRSRAAEAKAICELARGVQSLALWASSNYAAKPDSSRVWSAPKAKVPRKPRPGYPKARAPRPRGFLWRGVVRDPRTPFQPKSTRPSSTASPNDDVEKRKMAARDEWRRLGVLHLLR